MLFPIYAASIVLYFSTEYHNSKQSNIIRLQIFSSYLGTRLGKIFFYYSKIKNQMWPGVPSQFNIKD
jgi:hypothetical protein